MEGKGKNIGGTNFSKTDPNFKDLWATPQWAVDGLFEWFISNGFIPKGLDKLDVCASEKNAKCPYYIDAEMDTLKTEWGDNQLCWLNPPYSNVKPFLEKAVAETHNGNYTVALLKADCSTKWFKYAVENATAVMYITSGRIGFIHAESGEAVGGNSFSSVVFLFTPNKQAIQSVYVDKQDLITLAEKFRNGKELHD